MNRHRKWFLILLAVMLIGFLGSTAFVLHFTSRLLEQADLPLSCVRHVYDRGSWTDPLGYKDGCEWVILRVSDDFSPPENWTHQTAALGQINPASPDRARHYFDTPFSENKFLPETFTSWLYIPHNDAAPFEEREWFCAMYDQNSSTLAIYRGHTLYGF